MFFSIDDWSGLGVSSSLAIRDLLASMMASTRFIWKSILGGIYNLAIFGGLLFLPAGTLHWPRAWWFLGVVSVAIVLSLVSVFPGREDLLDERFKPPIQKGQPLTDRIILVALLVSFVVVVALIPLDVFQFHLLLGGPGAIVSFLGLVLFIAGWWIIAVALRANSFAAPVVRHQAERQQTVIDTGVYRFVRHPMYAGGVLFFVGMPLWLGSYAATLLALVPVCLLIIRIGIEECFLRRELKGYDAYTRKVRYRLIPYVW